MTRSEAAHLLGVAEDATPEAVQAAYRRGMSRWHPDRHRDDPEAARMAQEMAVLLGQARDVLLGRTQAQDEPPPPPPPMAQCPLCGGLVAVPPPPVCPHCGRRVYSSPEADEPTPEAAPRKPGPPIPWWVVIVALLMFLPVGAILAVVDLVALAAGRKHPDAPRDAHGRAWAVPGWLPPVAGVAVGAVVVGWPVLELVAHAYGAGVLLLVAEDLAGVAWGFGAAVRAGGRFAMRAPGSLAPLVSGGGLTAYMVLALPALLLGLGVPTLAVLASRWTANAVGSSDKS